MVIMNTRLHRLYGKRFAQTYQDLPEDMQVVQDQMEEAGGPVKIQYEPDVVPDRTKMYGPGTRFIPSYATTVVDGHRVLIVDGVGSPLDQLNVLIVDIGYCSVGSNGEIEVSGTAVTDLWVDSYIEGISAKGATERQLTEEEVQLVQNIIASPTDVGEHILPPFFKRMNVNTRLHRLYGKRFAQTYQDLPEDMQVVQDQMEEAGGQPVKVQYEPDMPPLDTNYHKVYIPSYAVTVVDGYRAMLVDNADSQLEQLEVYIAGVGSYTVSSSGEIEVSSHYSMTDAQMTQHIRSLTYSDETHTGATERQPTEEEIQLIQNILDGDNVGEHTLPPFFKRMDVNIVDENDGLETDHQLSLPEEYPAGEGDDSYHTRPGLDGPGHNLPKIEGEFAEFEEIEKEAGGFGLSLHEIITPSKGQGFTDNPADNHQTENLSEDPDLKLGDVEEPYSSQGGPINFRFEDDEKYNIVKGASMTMAQLISEVDEDIDPDEKEAIGIPDNSMNENSYTEGYGRSDSAIPRNPRNEGKFYGR